MHLVVTGRIGCNWLSPVDLGATGRQWYIGLQLVVLGPGVTRRREKIMMEPQHLSFVSIMEACSRRKVRQFW